MRIHSCFESKPCWNVNLESMPCQRKGIEHLPGFAHKWYFGKKLDYRSIESQTGAVIWRSSVKVVNGPKCIEQHFGRWRSLHLWRNF